MSTISERVEDLVSRTTYKPGYWFETTRNHTLGVSVRVAFKRPDVRNGVMGVGYGAWANITPEFTDADISRTLYGLVKALEEHESREWFKIDGSALFGPHIELDAMIEAGRHVQGQEVSP